MWNIIKAQLYQLRRERIIGIFFLLALFLMGTSIVGEILDDGNTFQGCEYILRLGSYHTGIAGIYVVLLTGIMVGMDFLNRTVNYELMTGHTRIEVFLGRVLPAICIGICCGIILLLIPAVVISLLFGWGNYFTVAQYTLRLLLMIFPFFRIICEMIFLTVMLKNPYVVSAVGYLVNVLGMFFPPSNVLGMSNLNLLCRYSQWEVYTFGEKSYRIVDAALNGADVVKTVAVSVLIGVLFLTLAYHYLHYDDLN